jgi:hypothetical protein
MVYLERVGWPDRLELFGREAIPGWTVFGNDVRPIIFSEAYAATG